MGCPYCGKPKVFLRSRPAKTKVLAKNSYMHDTYRWACDSCGRHERNGNYQMSIEAVKLRQLKVEAHRLVDYYWMYDEYTRRQVYERIRKILGLPNTESPNISKLNATQLKRVIQVVNEGNFLWYRRAL